MQFDAFICHASEDKKDIALPLKIELENLGLNIWYDDHSLEIGDNSDQSINHAIINSNYCIVVFSQSFVCKDYPQQELSAFKKKEKPGEKVILPVFHNIEINKVSDTWPILSSRVGANTRDGIVKVSNSIFKSIIKSDFTKLGSRLGCGLDKIYALSHELLKAISKSSRRNNLKLLLHLKEFILAYSNQNVELSVFNACKVVDYILQEVFYIITGQNSTLYKSNIYEILSSHSIFSYSLTKEHIELINAYNNKYQLSISDMRLCKNSLEIVLSWFFNSFREKLFEMDKFEIVKYPDEFSYQDVEQTYIIERKWFRPELIAPVEEVNSWYKFNPYTLIGVRDTNTHKIVGFINTLPIRDRLFDEIASGSYIDSQISLSDLFQYELSGIYKMHLSSICIDPEYQHKNILMMLYNTFIDQLINLAKKEVFISDIVADAITESGEKLCELIGMSFHTVTSHDTKIFKTSLLPPENNISRKCLLMAKNGKLLLDLYINKYKDIESDTQYLG